MKTNINIAWHKLKNNSSSVPSIEIDNLINSEKSNEYKHKLDDLNKIQEAAENSQECWNNIVNDCRAVGIERLGKKKHHKNHKNQKLQHLSEENKKLRIEIEKCKSTDERVKKQHDRKEIKKEINRELQAINERIIKRKLEDIERNKNDSTRYCKTCRTAPRRDHSMSKIKMEWLLGQKQKRPKSYTEYFKSILGPDDMQDQHITYPPTCMLEPFSGAEVHKVVKSMKNGKAAVLTTSISNF